MTMTHMRPLALAITMLDETFDRSPFVQIISLRHRPGSLAKVVLADARAAIYKRFAPGLPVTIAYGYEGDIPVVWQGWTTTRRAESVDQIEIGCVGLDRLLVDRKIKLAWENERPEAIVRHAIRMVDLSPGRVDVPGEVGDIPKFIAGNISLNQAVVQCTHTCQHAFGQDMSRWALWLDLKKNVVNWGDFDREGDVPVIESGGALIVHSPASDPRGLNRVETFLHAGFEHSEKFRLIDLRRDIDQEFRALSVRHQMDDQHLRTFIEYGVEYDQL